MLRHLRVTNFAILSDVAMDFKKGFNALTGETGAGKSLIVEAVNLLRGGRASADIPRTGAKEATVEAIFGVPEDLAARVREVLESAGLPDNDGEVLVRRVIHRGGRSRTYVNGALTTAKRLAELGSLLVDLSGQHQHQGLIDAKRHRSILDAFARNHRQVATMRAAHGVLREAEQAIAELTGDEASVQERMDYLRFQLEEIASVGLRPGEDEELERERVRLQAVDRLEAAARAAGHQVYDDKQAAVDRLGAAVRALRKVEDVDSELAELAKQLDDARVLAEDAASQLRHYVDGLAGDPQRLHTIDDRLATIRRLQRKHGGGVDKILARAEELQGELETLENRDLRLEELERARKKAESAARAAAANLSESRRQAAEDLATSVSKALAELGMASAIMSVDIRPRALSAEGADRVEFVLASNKGEDARPLAKVASGGELSRIMLALKLCLRRADEVATYVFDEVDSGIGGPTAEVVGRLIRRLGNQRQVLCVTHLPQIVAFADQHFHVSKFEADGRTETAVRTLTSKERRDEIARMLSGLKITASARKHADAMLAAASKRRPRA